MSAHTLRALALLPALTMLFEGHAQATACAVGNEWSVPVGTGAQVNASASSNINDWIFYPVGNSIRARDRQGSPLGAVGASQAIENTPAVVALPSTSPPASQVWTVFAGSQDGFLYRMQMIGGIMMSAGTHDMRRPGCAADAIEAAPAVQLKAFSNGFYTVGKDLVIVITHHMCGDYSQNQVIALDANNFGGPPVWTFNEFGEYQMDFGSEGCSLDYDNNRIYCGTNLSLGRFQNTVWAINTNNGALVWANNYNSVQNRPQLGRKPAGGGAYNHLYVADALTNLHALNPDTGVEDWNLLLNGSAGVNVTNNLWAEFRSPYDYLVLVTDTSGMLHAVYDGGTNAGDGVGAWNQDFASVGAKMVSLGTVAPTLGKMYVGLNDGTVRQLELNTGAIEARRLISVAVPTVGNNVSDPTMYVSNGGTDIDKLVVTAQAGAGGTVTEQFCVPFTYGSSGLDATLCNNDGECKALDSPCGNGTCLNPPLGTCYTKPKPDGLSCNDGEVCTLSDKCFKGACVGMNWDANNASCNDTNGNGCGRNPSKGCPSNLQCVKTPGPGGVWQCVNIKSNVNLCGGHRTCDNTGSLPQWGGDRVCRQGRCQRDESGYCGSIAADSAFVNSGGVNFDENITSLKFDKLSINLGGTQVSECHAWASTYYSNALANNCADWGCNQVNHSTRITNPPGSGTSCGGGLCSAAPYNSSNSVGLGGFSPASTSWNFFDPSPYTTAGSPGNVGRINVKVRGKRNIFCFLGCPACGGAVSDLTVSINGNVVQAGNTNSVDWCCNGGDTCRLIFDGLSTDYFPNSFPGYNKNGLNMLTISTTNGWWQIGSVEIVVYDNSGNNWVRRLGPSMGDGLELQASVHPGYMHGVAPTHTSYFGTYYPDGVFNSFVNKTTLPAGTTTTFTAPGKWNFNFPPTDAIDPIALTPASTSCQAGSGCTPIYGVVPELNDGLGPPATNGFSAGSASFALFYPNWAANGDVYKVVFSPTLGASPIASSPPPWCGGAPCTTRVTDVDYIPSSRTGSDALLRIAYGSKVAFWDLVAQKMTKCVDLNTEFCARQCAVAADCAGVPNTSCAGGFCVPPSSCNPASTCSGGNCCPLGTQCSGTGGICKPLDRWTKSPVSTTNIDRIFSMSADPLNLLNDTVLEVRELQGANPYYFTVQVRGDDNSVRPLQRIKLATGQIYQGVYNDMGVTGVTPPVAPRPTTEMKSTASAQQHLYRFTPVSPAAAASTAVTRYKMYP